ncbi:MAG: TcpQ domain-containing protein [Burkholderiaceae bacterium]|nr:TcpQ domain-containing protein [Burkholderiaceae bacterium]
MVRLLLVTLAAGLLSACTHLPEWVRLTPLGAPGSQSLPVTETSQYSFAWRLSGDRQVAPLQVFDNGKQTWLQFQPDQSLPAIFQHTPQGDRPLTYQRQGPYVVLPGVWPHLVLRGGQLQSRVERVLADQKDISVIPAGDSGADDGRVVSVDIAQADPLVPVDPVDSQAIALTEPSFGPALLTALPQTPSDSPALVELPSSHAVSPQDKNLRSALSRWAMAAGWTFEPEHWVVDADIPIVGSATFDTGFKHAVQDLVATTELADRPLQPCFYSNRVLRIVPYAQTCDRSAGVGVS